MKKAWTPDDCPLQVGSVIHCPYTNSDRMVIRRYFNHEGDNTDVEKSLVILDMGVIYTGSGLMHNEFTYYPNWPDTSVEKPCCNEVKEEPDIGKLAQYVFDGLKESKYAVEGVHYNEDGGSGFVWQNDIHDKVSDIIVKLTNIFEEVKHDEQQ